MTVDARDRTPGGPIPPGADPVFVAVGEVLRDFAGRAGYGFTDAEVLANLTAVHAMIGIAQAVFLGLVAELDSRPDAVPGSRAGKTAVTFLTEGLRVAGPQAGRDVRAAAAIASTAPELPAMGAALAAGEVSREHVDVAVSTLRQVPKALKTASVVDETTGEVRPGVAVIDEVLTDQSRTQSPATVDVLGRQIVAHIDPDRTERFDTDAYRRRSYSWTRDFAGMGVYKVALDPATDLMVQTAVTAASAPTPTGTAVGEDGKTVQVRDERTPGQRKADAVATLLLAGAHALDITLPTGNEEPPHTNRPSPEPSTDESSKADGHGEVERGGPSSGLPGGVFAARPWTGATLSLVATVDQLAYALGATDAAVRTSGLAHLSLAGTAGTYAGATIAPEVLARYTCDTPIRRILLGPGGTILDHGRAQRFATPAQKRALAVRDQGCVIPGCHCPPDWCDAHHIITWEDGGTTDLDNLALLCSRHHTALHAGVYELEFRDGIPWIRPPAWHDPARPWLRNTTHHDHHHTATRLARQLTEGRE